MKATMLRNPLVRFRPTLLPPLASQTLAKLRNPKISIKTSLLAHCVLASSPLPPVTQPILLQGAMPSDNDLNEGLFVTTQL